MNIKNVFILLDKHPQQQAKSVVVSTSQVNVMKKQKKVTTTVK
jgi:hypothetical protein